ncbi:MAG: 3-deoxy-7-phosphoheptulonate synthase [Oscillospiraceae bacterium]|nr:3-deoxy-7-phosphoheptulonate synthase [Oscillospiraceae bacterium]
MIIILKRDADPAKVETLSKFLQEQGLIIQDIKGENTHMIGLAGDTSHLSREQIEANDFVESVKKISEPYKLAGRKFHPEDTIVDVGGHKIGGGNFAVIAGPCSVESEEQILSIARDVAASGAAFLRGGAFKPRSSPYAFQGMGLDGLELLKIARQKTGLPIVTEILNPVHLEAFARDVDVIQIGARNMQNFSLLREVGALKKPVLLKRGLCATIEETLMAAEYLMASGAKDIVICERGIRTYETATRNTLDLSAVPVIKSKSHLPVVVDPSHGTGYWHLVEPMALGAVAVGADGLIIEVHNAPQYALCDGAQSITPEVFHRLMKRIAKVHAAVNEG